MRHYLNDDDEVIVSRSSFPVYDVSTLVMRAKLTKIPMRNYTIDLDAMAVAIGPRTKMIVVCNPNNPTGTIVTAEEFDRFMQRVPDNVLVVIDEAYLDFVDSSEYPDSLPLVREGRKNVLVLRTFSKSHGIAGLRLGYGIAHQELLAPMNAAKESFPVNRLAQIAGLAALEDEEFLRQTVEINDRGRKYLYGEFARLGIGYVESHGNFVLAEIGPNAADVYQKLLRAGVIVRPCVGYDLPNCLRISVGTPEQNKRLIEALGQVI